MSTAGADWTVAVQGWLDSPDVAILGTGMLVGVAAALLGPFLILRRNAMLSDAISHSIVLGIVAVWLLTGAVSGPLQILGAAAAGLLTVWLTEALTASGRVRDDAAIGLVFPALFALGVLLLNLYAREVHVDAHSVLLGEIGFVWLDTAPVGPLMVPRALLTMAAVTAVNAAFVTLLWKELKIATFDPVLARALGFAPRALFLGLLALLSGTAVAAFDAVGAVLFVAFVIVPPAAAYLLTDRLGRMVGIGIGIALLSTVAGYLLAIAWDVSIGGMMAVMTGVFLLGAFLAGPRHGLVAGLLRRRAQAREALGRALVVHLMVHEHDPDGSAETVTGALRTHLGWSAVQASRVLSDAQQRGDVIRRGTALSLTDAGRARARAVIEPWRRGPV